MMRFEAAVIPIRQGKGILSYKPKKELEHGKD